MLMTTSLGNSEVVFQCAAPLRWRAADGGLLEMDGPQTIRARELRDLYNDVSLWVMSQEQRRHVLTTLRHTVQVPHRSLPTTGGGGQSFLPGSASVHREKVRHVDQSLRSCSTRPRPVDGM